MYSSFEPGKPRFLKQLNVNPSPVFDQSTINIVRAEVVHSILILIGTSTAIAMISRLARRGRLNFQYTIGWLIVFSLSLLSAPVLPFMDLVSRNLHLGPASVFAVAALVLLAMIAVQLSISISGLQEQVRQLNEDTAFLRLQNFESKQLNGGISDVFND